MSRRGRGGPACPPAFGVVNQIRADTQVCPYNRINSAANFNARHYNMVAHFFAIAALVGAGTRASSRQRSTAESPKPQMFLLAVRDGL